MREIKFRARDFERKQFNFLDLRDAIASDDAYFLCGDQGTDWLEDRENSCTMSCKCELQQFTGLKDKNGVEIYEGDVIDGNLYDRKLPTRGQIVFDAHFSFYANKNEGGNTPIYRIAEIKIIGNIHENPELLND